MDVRGLVALVRDAARGWSADNASRLAAALAFFTAFAFAPLIVVVVELAAFVLGGTGHHQVVRDQLLAALRPSLGDQGAKAVGDVVQSTADSRKTGVVAGSIGWITLLIAASGFFGAVQDALDTVWHVKPRTSGMMGMVRDRFSSMALLAGAAFLLLASFVVNAGIAAFDRALAQIVPAHHALLVVVSGVVSLGVTAALFAAIYKMLPKTDLSWRDVLFGALVTAVLFMAGQYAIGWYLGHIASTTAYGAAGSFVALLLWFYYSGQIFLFGAELTKSNARMRRSNTREEQADASG